MPQGHGYPSQYQQCRTRQAHAQIVVEFDGADPLPTAYINDCLGSCGIASVQVVKEFATRTVGECAAYKVKVVYDACYFAVGLPPLLQVSTCAPSEHNFNAEVRNICDVSNGQCAYFRVGLKEAGSACYPQCAGSQSAQPAGVVAFTITALQGTECQ